MDSLEIYASNEVIQRGYIMTVEATIALVASIIAVVGTIIGWHDSAKKNSLDQLSVLVDSLQKEVTRLRSERDDCKSEITLLRKELLKWKKGVMLLVDQLVKQGLEPAWQPPNGEE